jgi:hypothetical protein
MTRTKSRLLLAGGIVASIASEGGGGGSGCDNPGNGSPSWEVTTTATLPPTTIAAGTTSLKFVTHAELYSSAPFDTYAQEVSSDLDMTIELELGAAPPEGYAPELLMHSLDGDWSESVVKGYIDNPVGKIVGSSQLTWGGCLLSMTIPCYDNRAMEITFPAQPADLVRSISGTFKARIGGYGDDQPPRGTEIVLAIEVMP